ncbi:MAG: hypothetical protein ACXV8I_04020 [Methylobacter sp.]
MNKKIILLIVCSLLQGCPSKIAVMTLESTIENAAKVAKQASNGSSKNLNIEVNVTNGFKGSATAPIPVVPVGIEDSSSTSVKLTLDIDLQTYSPPIHPLAVGAQPPQLYTLDTDTGKLEDTDPK